MKRMMIFFLLCALCGAGFAQEPPKQNGAPPAEAAATAKAVPIDDELTALISDRNVLGALIELTENARGAVTLRYSIAELRKMDQGKLARIAAWFKARGVPHDLSGGWRIAPDGKSFVPPPAAADEPPPAPKKPAGPPKKENS